jgi:putative PEP-CTERM system TPR-repeat lipoprotein
MLAALTRAWIPPLSVLVVVSISCSRDPEVAKREYVASGDQFLSQGKVKEAIVQYRNALRYDPRSGEARYKLAEAFVQDHDWARAGREYIRAADLMPKDVRAQLKAGQFLLFARQFEDAATRAHNVLALDRKNVEAQILLGNALAGLRDLEGAVEEIQEAIKLNPNSSLGYVSLAALEQAAGRRAEAEAAFKKAIAADPEYVAAHLGLANFYWATRRAKETAQTLQQAYAIDPNHPLTNRMLALFQIATGKPADAEPYLIKLAQVSEDPNSQSILADYYIASGQSDKAVPVLKQMASSPEARGAADLRLAELDFREGRLVEARTRLNGLLEREPRNASGLLLQARFLSAEGKLDEAMDLLQAAARANPASAEAQFALGQAYAARNDPDQAVKAFNETLRLNPRAVAAQLELARLELAAGRPDSSVQFAEQALKNAPRNPQAQLALVRGLMARRDVRRAESALQPLLKQYPNDAAVQTQAGMLSAMKGDRSGAARTLTRALELDPNHLDALGALVSLDLAGKNPSSAVARVETRLARTPNDAGALVLAARTYVATGDLKKAEQALRRAIEVDSSNYPAYSMLGHLYFSQRRLDEALAEFDELSKRQPRPIQAHTLAGVILEAQKKPEDARKRYEQALALDPEMPVAANNLAWMYVETGGNLDVALQLAQAATRRLPDNPAIQDTLGWIYYKKGLIALAVPPFQRCVELDPSNPVFHFHLGLAYLKAGDSPKARTALRHALTLAPDFAGASEAKQALASLKG